MADARTEVHFKEIDLGAEVKKIWGQRWNAPEVSYEFSNGKKYELKTEDAAIYETSPDF